MHRAENTRKIKGSLAKNDIAKVRRKFRSRHFWRTSKVLQMARGLSLVASRGGRFRANFPVVVIVLPS